MEEKKFSLTAEQITVERFPLTNSEGNDYANLTSNSKIVNGEGSGDDGSDVDGNDGSDGDDARF